MTSPFRIGLTRDFLKSDGSIGFGDIGLGLLDNAPGVEWSFLSENVRELRADLVADYDGLLVLAPRISAATVEAVQRLTIVARFGVGYDSVDVEACTKNGVLLTITPDGVRRPVAVAAITLLLALSHKLLIKDRLTRAGGWADKLNHMGQGVTGRTLGVIGLGNIGREVFSLARPFGMKQLASDPFADPAAAASAGVTLVELDRLLAESDYVCITCALTPATRRLIGPRQLALMKPNAYLINVARGGVVDQAALTAALTSRQIQGAGLDVFDPEPIDSADPLLSLDNVILAPHGISWTDECFLGIGTSACRGLLEAAAGRVPANVVNSAAAAHPRLRAALARFAARSENQ